MRKASAARLISTILVLILLLSLPACGTKPAATWQEQYDLGIRYLSQGNYKEAILAFTAAIDIDPKQADAYVKLADVYTAQGDKAKAAEVLTQALSAVGENEAVASALAALDVINGVTTPDDSSGESSAPTGQPGEPLPAAPVVRSERTDLDNGRYYIREYDAEGRVVRLTQYTADGTATYIQEYFYDAAGNRVARKDTWPGNEHILYEESRLDLLKRETETTEYHTDGSVYKFTYLYDGTTVTVTADFTTADEKTATFSTMHTLQNAKNYVLATDRVWDSGAGIILSLNLKEYGNAGMVASLSTNVDSWTGSREQLYCRYEGATVYMDYLDTVDGSTDITSMVYTMASPENYIYDGRSSGPLEISFTEVVGSTGESTHVAYDMTTKTFSKAEN